MRCNTMSNPTEGKWPRWAYEAAVRASDLEKCARAVALNLSHHANDEGHAWPKATTIASETGWSERAVRSARQNLCESGWLDRDANSSMCRLRQPARPAVQPARGAGWSEEAQPARPAAQPARPAAQPARPAPINKPTNKPTNKPLPCESDGDAEWLMALLESRGARLPVGGSPAWVICSDVKAALGPKSDFRVFVASRVAQYAAQGKRKPYWAADLIRDAAGGRAPAAPRNALNRPDDELGQKILADMLANASVVTRGDE